MDYPQLFIPDNLIKIISIAEYPAPIEPISPHEPKYESNTSLKLIIFSIGIVLLFFQSLFGFAFIILSIYWSIYNPEKKSYYKAKEKYSEAIIRYQKQHKLFISEIDLYKNSNKEYNLNKKKEQFFLEISKRISPSIQQDYKRGISHNFFKNFLTEYFNVNIIENAAIKKYNSYYNETDFKPYITDFAFIDKNTRLIISIEIDEPYTIKEMKPIHLDDQDRNNFFLDKGWLVLRFAEEQVVIYPDYCCEYIQSIIEAVNQDCTTIKSLNHKINNVKKWDAELANQMIKSNYRHTYIDKIISSEHLTKIRSRQAITSSYKDMLSIYQPNKP